jgi:predicted AlkP superfamily pyrophosphatase or phosphodiesterase
MSFQAVPPAGNLLRFSHLSNADDEYQGAIHCKELTMHTANRVVVLMIDGFGQDYFDPAGDLPDPGRIEHNLDLTRSLFAPAAG